MPAARRRGWGLLRDGTLLLFLTLAYLVAPVLGFGGLLALMGSANTESDRRGTAFLAMLVVLQLYEALFRYAM